MIGWFGMLSLEIPLTESQGIRWEQDIAQHLVGMRRLQVIRYCSFTSRTSFVSTPWRKFMPPALANFRHSFQIESRKTPPNAPHHSFLLKKKYNPNILFWTSEFSLTSEKIWEIDFATKFRNLCSYVSKILAFEKTYIGIVQFLCGHKIE